jgi:glycolate dehydrogenase FAD-binding subunit
LPSVSSLAEAAAALEAASGDGRRVRIGDDLTTDGLTRILEHEAGDLTCTVEAGIRLSELNAALARSGQRLSLDPPGDPTIGALLAENLSGPLRHRFGAPRDVVLGVTLVLADGTIASAGGKVVKNVAGYDLSRLVCGSRGRLALVARASFRLHPVPRASRTLVVETGEPAATVSALLRSQLEPSALDVLHPGRVAALFEGSPRAVETQVAAARALAGGEESGPVVWAESRSRQREAGGSIRFKPGDLGEFLAGVADAVVRPAAGVAYVRQSPSVNLTQGGSHDALALLHERILRAFDPNGTLGG